MKKALITGLTAMQCGSQRTKFKITCAGSAWAAALKDLGYSVDHRQVRIDEKDWKSYDVVLVGLSSVKGLGTWNLYAVLRLLAERPDAIIFVDDWATKMIMPSFGFLRRSSKLWTSPVYRFKDEAKPYKAKIEKAFDEISAGWKRPTLVCTHGLVGPDSLKLLKLPGQLVAVDPTPFTSPYVNTGLPKQRRWLWASLARKGKQLQLFGFNTLWPIEVYNNLKPEELPGRATLRAMKTEPELLEEYEQSWGIVMPQHPGMAGSGWWRVRYLIGRDLGCVVSAPAADAALLGESYSAAVDGRDVEQLSDKQLKALAKAQAADLDRVSMTRDQVISIFSNNIRRKSK